MDCMFNAHKNHISNESDGNTFQVGEEAEKDGQTLLVPTNAAFDKLPEDVNSRLLADQAFAQKVVQRHILDEVLSSSENFLNILDVISSEQKHVGKWFYLRDGHEDNNATEREPN